MSPRRLRIAIATSALVWAGALSITSAGVLVASAQQAATEPARDDKADKALLDDLCAACHESSLVEGPLRAPAEWDETIEKMQAYGASVSKEQFAQLRTYLLRTFGKANVNKAAAPDLAPVLDITVAVAEAVVAHRQQNGPFKTLDDLKMVPGLDAAKVDGRKARLMF